MKRLLLLAFGVLLVSGPAFAQAKADKTTNANGTVSAVSDTSLTVKGKTAEWTFMVDKSTHVSVAGATKKTAAAKESKEPLAITQYVKVGDSVLVKYHEQGAMKHAADVVVNHSTPAAPKKK